MLPFVLLTTVEDDDDVELLDVEVFEESVALLLVQLVDIGDDDVEVDKLARVLVSITFEVEGLHVAG